MRYNLRHNYAELFAKFLVEKERVPDKNILHCLKRFSDCYRCFDLPVRIVEEELKK